MKTATLGEVAECLDRLRVPVTESERAPGDVPYYGANGQQGWIDRAIFNEPLVIVAEDGGHFANPSRGVAYRIDGPSWVNNHGHVLRSTSAIDTDYLFQVLRNYDFRPYISGSTRSKLTQKQLLKAEIPLPPFPEQRRIAAILDHADALRAKRRQVLTHLQSVLPSQFAATLAQSEHIDVPLAEVAEIWDCPHSTPKWTDAGAVCLRTPNLTAGGWRWDDTRYVDEEQFAKRSKGGGVRPGDIILSREGTVGIAAIVQAGMRVCMGQRLVQVRPRPDELLPEWALAYLLTALHPSRIARVMVGSTAQHLNVKDLRALPVPVPSLDVQRAFAGQAGQVERGLGTATRAIAADDELFASLQSRAFRGEL